MATQPKSLFSAGKLGEIRRIASLAEQPALFQAQRWFAREKAWITEQQLSLSRIPAPTFFEQQRADWVRGQLELFGWDARLDRAGNVLARFTQDDSESLIVVSAHLDTVLAPNRPEDISVSGDGRLHGPGVSDNGSGLAALLTLARLMATSPDLHDLANSILLVANVGEEGEGNLSGMRYLCRHSLPGFPVRAFVVLDGPSTDHITVQALASRRFEVSFAGPGGHSWNDWGTPNPVHALANAVSYFLQTAESRVPPDRRGKSSYNFGILQGGSSINAIPTSALVKVDLRSEEPSLLDEFASLLTTSVERSLERENREARSGRLTAKIRELGSRPGGSLPSGSPLLHAIQAVDHYLHIRSRIDCASTDANVPLSMGMPAISIGAGGQGGGAHTPQEWYSPEGRELGLRRILLVIAALSGNTFGAGDTQS